MSRTTDLLKAAADALDDGRDPLHRSFLVEHAVSFDECMTLAEMLAAGARIMAFALEHPQVARGAVNGAHTASVYRALLECRPDAGDRS